MEIKKIIKSLNAIKEYLFYLHFPFRGEDFSYTGAQKHDFNDNFKKLKKEVSFLRNEGIRLPPLFRNTHIENFDDAIALKKESCERQFHNEEELNNFEKIIKDDFGELVSAVDKNIFKIEHHIPPDSDTSNDKKSSYRLANGTKWEHIEIKFSTEVEIEVFIRDKFFKKLTNEDLGFFSGKKNKKPDRGWNFLLLLSVVQENKETEATKVNIADSLTRKSDKIISTNNCEKIKSDLSKKLQKSFGIDSEPFEDYKEYGYYKTKFRLKPMPLLRGKGNVFITKRNELKEGFDYGKNNQSDEKGYTKL